MPAIPTIPTVVLWETNGLTVMSRIRGNAGVLITQSTIQSIAGHVFDLGQGGAEVLPAPTITVAGSVFNTLQTNAVDPRWTLDTTGYNWGSTFPAACFPKASRYQVEVIYTPVVGDNFALVVSATAQRLLSQPA